MSESFGVGGFAFEESLGAKQHARPKIDGVVKLGLGLSDTFQFMLINFDGLDLQERDFSGQDLTGAVFSNANAQHSVFDGVVATNGLEILSSDTDELDNGRYDSSLSLLQRDPQMA